MDKKKKRELAKAEEDYYQRRYDERQFAVLCRIVSEPLSLYCAPGVQEKQAQDLNRLSKKLRLKIPANVMPNLKKMMAISRGLRTKRKFGATKRRTLLK